MGLTAKERRERAQRYEDGDYAAVEPAELGPVPPEPKGITLAPGASLKETLAERVTWRIEPGG
jgi:hypothetical protein